MLGEALNTATDYMSCFSQKYHYSEQTVLTVKKQRLPKVVQEGESKKVNLYDP